jgi:phosphate transport system permease protein
MSNHDLQPGAGETRGQRTRRLVEAGLRRRYRAERRFRAYGILAVASGLLFVVFLFASIVSSGWSVLQQSYLRLAIDYSAEVLDPEGNRNMDEVGNADFAALIKAAMRQAFPGVEGRSNLRALYGLASSGAQFDLRKRVLAEPALIGRKESLWILADDRVDLLLKGRIDRSLPEDARGLSDRSWPGSTS